MQRVNTLYNRDKRTYSIRHDVTMFLCCLQSDQKMSKNPVEMSHMERQDKKYIAQLAKSLYTKPPDDAIPAQTATAQNSTANCHN